MLLYLASHSVILCVNMSVCMSERQNAQREEVCYNKSKKELPREKGLTVEEYLWDVCMGIYTYLKECFSF